MVTVHGEPASYGRASEALVVFGEKVSTEFYGINYTWTSDISSKWFRFETPGVYVNISRQVLGREGEWIYLIRTNGEDNYGNAKYISTGHSYSFLTTFTMVMEVLTGLTEQTILWGEI